jgi:hypothetical protein
METRREAASPTFLESAWQPSHSMQVGVPLRFTRMAVTLGGTPPSYSIIFFV